MGVNPDKRSAIAAAREAVRIQTVKALAAELERLMAERDELLAAIKEHRDQRGDDRCWLDDQKLYVAAGLGETATGETALPPKCDFLKSCERYWHQRQAPLEHGTGAMPGGMTIAQLTQEALRLRAERDALLAACEEVAVALRDEYLNALKYARSNVHIGLDTKQVTSFLATIVKAKGG
jgi:uncharacterized coiled-coil DUF342 family protein